MNAFRSFFLILTGIMLAVLAADYAIFTFGLKQQPSLWIYLSLAYLYVINLVVHYILLKSADKRPAQFVNNFMATMSLKMFLGLGFIVVMIYLDRENKAPNAIHFLAVYMGLLAFEIVRILKDLRKTS